MFRRATAVGRRDGSYVVTRARGSQTVELRERVLRHVGVRLRAALRVQKASGIGARVDAPTICGDSGSAIALVGRRGPGRLRRMEIRWLALPSWQQAGLVRVRKISGQTNPADV